jgi:hypothetical protein
VAPLGGHDRHRNGRSRFVAARCPLGEQGGGRERQGRLRIHPIYCFADATGETLAARWRPDNAGANNIADHVAVFDAAIGPLPDEIAVGHRPGDDPGLVCRAIQVRVDSAGCTDFVRHARDRDVGFTVVTRTNPSIHAAISLGAFDHTAWCVAAPGQQERPARRGGGRTHRLVDLTNWPAGTRLIVRKYRCIPAPQQSLFPAMFRYWGYYIDAESDPVELDVHVRTHAAVDDHIRLLRNPAPSASRSATSTPTGLGSPSSASPTPRTAGSSSLSRTGTPAAAEPQDSAFGLLAHPRSVRAPRPPPDRTHPRRCLPPTASLAAYQRIALVT